MAASVLNRSGSLAAYLQAAHSPVAAPLRAVVPALSVATDKLLLDVKKPFLCRESLNGLSPKTTHPVSCCLSGEFGRVPIPS